MTVAEATAQPAGAAAARLLRSGRLIRLLVTARPEAIADGSIRSISSCATPQQGRRPPITQPSWVRSATPGTPSRNGEQMNTTAWRWFPLGLIAMAFVFAINGYMVYAALDSFPGHAGTDGFDLSNGYGRVLERSGCRRPWAGTSMPSVDRSSATTAAHRPCRPAARPDLRSKRIVERPVGPHDDTPRLPSPSGRAGFSPNHTVLRPVGSVADRAQRRSTTRPRDALSFGMPPGTAITASLTLPRPPRAPATRSAPIAACRRPPAGASAAPAARRLTTRSRRSASAATTPARARADARPPGRNRPNGAT